MLLRDLRRGRRSSAKAPPLNTHYRDENPQTQEAFDDSEYRNSARKLNPVAAASRPSPGSELAPVVRLMT